MAFSGLAGQFEKVPHISQELFIKTVFEELYAYTPTNPITQTEDGRNIGK
jgi:hypothetical protein